MPKPFYYGVDTHSKVIDGKVLEYEERFVFGVH